MNIKSDKGYVLVVAMGAILLVTAIGLSTYVIASRSMGQASTTARSSSAYQVAASALELEISRFNNGENLVSETGKTLPTGEVYSLTSNLKDGLLTLTCTSQRGDQRESVSASYETATGLTDTIYSGAGNFFQGGAINTPQSKIIGALYMKHSANDKVNSSVEFIDGPLTVEGGGKFTNGTRFSTTPNCPNDPAIYHAYTESDSTISDGNVIVGPIKAKLTPPAISPETEEAYRQAAKENGQYYAGSLVIGASSGPLPADRSGTISLSGTYFAEGPVTVSSNVTGYKGNFTVYSKTKIVADGRLIPADYATNPASPPSGAYDASYSAYIGSADELPQARANYCASLVSPGTINLNWSQRGNSPQLPFAFCGLVFSTSTVTFQESLRGTIVASGGLLASQKAILATQLNLNEILPDTTTSLLSGTLARGYWVRGK